MSVGFTTIGSAANNLTSEPSAVVNCLSESVAACKPTAAGFAASKVQGDVKRAAESDRALRARKRDFIFASQLSQEHSLKGDAGSYCKPAGKRNVVKLRTNCPLPRLVVHHGVNRDDIRPSRRTQSTSRSVWSAP